MTPRSDDRLPFVHQAELSVAPGTDTASPGAEVTRALCGHWEHEGACRWPHNNEVVSNASGTYFRTLFIAPPSEEAEVRARIEQALRTGQGWSVLSSGPRPVLAAEEPLAQRMSGARKAPGGPG